METPTAIDQSTRKGQTTLQIICGDALTELRKLPAESVQCCVTSPPYWGLRDYDTAQWEGGEDGCDHIERNNGNKGNTTQSHVGRHHSCPRGCGAKRIDSQLGLEKTPEEYVAKMVEVFREVRRVMRKDGTCWINLGDSYWNGGGEKRDGGHGFVDGGKPKLEAAKGSLLQAKSQTRLGLKPKDLCGIPWRVAFALQADGWWLRSDIIWAKPNPMPESVTDRPTKSHEYLFLLTKSANYFYDAEAIKERSVDPIRAREKNNGESAVDTKTRGYDCNCGNDGNRNKRSVWTVATAPFSDWIDTVRWRRVEDDARGDGIRRIVLLNSEDCGGLFDLLATVLDDEHGETSLTRILGISDRLSLEPKDGYVPFEQLRAYCFYGENLDSFLLRYFDVASRRSIEKNKTGLFVATSRACIPSAERACRIERILSKHGLKRLYLDMLLNNTWPDEMDVRLWDQILYRKACNVSFGIGYRETREKTSHFACFPPDLIKPCIMAGTSAKGCCAKCGSPWERIIEKGESSWEARKAAGHTVYGLNPPQSFDTVKVIGRKNEGGLGWVAESKTIGWQPTCKCDAEIVPCSVLDMFGGSGTTGMVALELGRKAILIELNPKYIELIHQRCNVTPGLALA